MAQQLGIHTPLSEDKSLTPSTHMEWLKIDCNSSPMESDTLFWLFGLCTQQLIPAHKDITKTKQILKSYNKEISAMNLRESREWNMWEELETGRGMVK